MKRCTFTVALFISMVLLASISLAQPGAIATNNLTGASTFDCTATSVVGGFRQARIQAGTSSSAVTWEFPATCAFPGDVWRPYASGTAAVAFNSFIAPVGGTGSALYNSSNGGASGTLATTTSGRYYTFNVSNVSAPTNANMEVLETSFNPVTISTVANTTPANASNSVLVTVTTSSAPASGENVFVRYSTDAFTTSTIVQCAFSGTTGQAMIPCVTGGATVNYYVYSSPKSLASINSDVTANGQSAHDMATLNLNNNGGSNYTYTQGSATNFGGVYNIPGACFATMASFVTGINAGTITAAVTCYVNAGYTETAPAGGFSITATGTVTNTITLVKFNTASSTTSPTFTAFTPQVTGSAASSFDAVFKIVGGDYITIQDFTMLENGGNTVTTPGTTNTMTEFGVLLVHTSATDGCQNNTIQNNTITLNSTYTNSVGIFSTSASSSANASLDATSTAGTNSSNKIYGNTISSVAQGILFICPPITATIFETGNDIGGSALATGNNVTFGNATASSGPWNRSQSTVQAGIYYRNGAGNNMRFNTVTSSSAAYVGSGGLNGIMISSGTAPTGVTYTSTISDNTIAITSTGVALMTGIDFGHGISTGTIVGSSNNVTVNQTSSAANTAVAIGIKANYASATNTCNSNTVVLNISSSTGALSGAATGITLAGTATTNTANSNNVTINQTGSGTGTITSTTTALSVAGAATTINALTNTILVNQTTSVATGITTGTISGVLANAVATTVNVTTTNAITVKQAVTGGGTYGTNAVTYINVSAASGTVNVTGNTLNTTGSTIRSTGTLIGVFQDATVTVLVNIKSNTMNVDRVAASGAVSFTTTSGTPSEVADTVSSNNITFTSLTGTSSVTAISSGGGPISPVVNNKRINNNTISISGTHTGTSIGITCSFTNTGFITGNSITISCVSPTVTGITTSSTAVTMSGNTLSLTSSTLSPTAMTAIAATSPTGAHSITANTFTAMNFNGIITGSPTVSGITIAGGTAANVFSNTVTNITVGAATSSANPIVDGIVVSGGVSVSVFKNNIYGIVSNCTGTTGVVNGIRISGGGSTGNNYYNNLIGNLTSPAAASTDGIRGISITSSSTTTTNNVYYNTIYLNASSIGTNFGTTGIFHTASATSTTATLNLRNNIIVNNSTPAGTGLVTCFRRSAAATLGNYGATSNNNDFFTTTGSVMHDGTTAFTIATFKAAVTSRDAASFSEDPEFQSTTGSSANFLKYKVTTAKQIESGAVNISTFTDDYFGTIRQGNGGYAGTGTAPDMGAWELEGIAADLTAPVISAITPVGNSCSVTSRNVTATITDATGVDNASFKPRIYFRKNAGAYFSAAGSLTSGTVNSGTWTFTITYATVGGAVAADVIDYFIVAQDVAGTPNVGGNPSTGLVLTDVNTVTTPPTTPLTYTIGSTLAAGTYSVGAGSIGGEAGHYATITLAVADYNTKCLGGNIIFALTDASYSRPDEILAETFPITILANNDADASHTLTIKPDVGVSPAISGSSASALILLNGADYVTINGSNSGGTTRDMTITNTNAGTTSAVLWGQTATADGATNNTIKNLNLVGNSNTTTLFGVGFGSSTIGTSSLGTGNNTNTIQNNNISKTQYGIYTQGASAGSKNTGNMITQNLINTVSPNNVSKGGIWAGFEDNVTISGNTISEISQTSSPDVFGITLGFGTSMSTTSTSGNEVTNATVSKNVIGNIINSGTFSSSGISLSAATSGTNTIVNNMIYGVTANGTAGDFAGGIVLGGGTGSTTNVYYNSVSMQGTIPGSTAASQVSACLAITNSTAPTLDVRDNIFSNTQLGNTSATLKFVAIGLGYSSTTGNYAGLTSNYNDLYSTGAGPGTYFTGITGGLVSGTTRALLADWQTETGRDAQSVSGNPAFTSTTNLHIDPTIANSWNVNGRGIAIATINNDIDGDSRSTTVGIPTDIGADEFTPTVEPAAAAMSGTISDGGTTTFSSAGRTLGQITWHGSTSPTTLPTTVTFKYYPGVTGPNLPGGTLPDNIKSYWHIEADVTSGFTYDLAFFPTQAEMNGILMAALQISKQNTGVTWWGTITTSGSSFVVNAIATNPAFPLSDFSNFTLTNGAAPLPIQLASFTGVEVPGQGVRLNWRTLSEVNNYGFYVQRKRQNETQWTEVPNSFIAGHGTTNEPHNYVFLDRTVSSGSWQYRLRQQDLDGTSHFTEGINISVLTAVREAAPIEFALLQNYPNPFNPETNIKFSVETLEHTTLEIYNIVGQKVATLFNAIAEPGYYYTVKFSANGGSASGRDAANLASGIYFYRLQSGAKSDLKKLLLLK